MATDDRCYLLELPRELRNYVFDELRHEVRISNDVPEVDSYGLHMYPPVVDLGGACQTALLLVSHQIHDEYAERNRSRTTLSIWFFGGPSDDDDQDWRCSISSLILKPDVPLGWLEHARTCLIHLNWRTVLSVFSDYQVWLFTELPTSQLRAQGTLPWTPTKGLYDEMKKLLNGLEQLLPKSAFIHLAVSIDGYPDTDDPYWTSERETDDDEPPSRSEMEEDQSIFDRDTWLRLKDDESIMWSRSNQLVLNFLTNTPLYCTLASNSKEVMESRKAYKAGLTQDLVQPIYTKSTEDVYWLLTADEGPESWRGYRPEFMGIELNDSTDGGGAA